MVSLDSWQIIGFSVCCYANVLTTYHKTSESRRSRVCSIQQGVVYSIPPKLAHTQEKELKAPKGGKFSP